MGSFVVRLSWGPAKETSTSALRHDRKAEGTTEMAEMDGSKEASVLHVLQTNLKRPSLLLCVKYVGFGVFGLYFF